MRRISEFQNLNIGVIEEKKGCMPPLPDNPPPKSPEIIGK
jgi:hypothetical protein